MILIGLTGPMACGKSTVAKILEKQYEIPVINADLLSKTILEEDKQLQKEILEFFGPHILNNQGILDRKLLGSMVFEREDRKLWLESKIHPLVKQKVEALKKSYNDKGHSVVIYDVPLLFEKKMEKDFDTILLIACSRETQMIRAKKRDQLSEKEILNRISHQLPLEQKIKKSHYILWNSLDQDLLSLEKDLKAYYQWFRTEYFSSLRWEKKEKPRLD
jgi:dephospho-CoA kinase